MMHNKNKKILIVDDSRAVQTIVRRGIEALGYDNILIKNADNGIDALEIVKVWDPDIVLSDWHMPEMTGLELLKEINKEMLSIDVGFITTETSRSRINEVIDLGAKFVVQKPFDFATLHAAVIPLLQGSSDADDALVNTRINESKVGEGVTLPSMTQIEEFSNRLAARPLHFKEIVDKSEFKPVMPYVLGLYEDPETSAIKVVSLMDVNSACLCAVGLEGVNDDDVHIGIAERVIKKQFLQNCEYIFDRMSRSIVDLETGVPLRLRSVNVIGSNTKAIDLLLGSREKISTRAEVRCEGFGVGQFAFISA